jgi:hypothetical protein
MMAGGEEVLKVCVKEGVVVERAEQTLVLEEHVMVAERVGEGHILRVFERMEEG